MDEQIVLAQDTDFKPTKLKLTTDVAGNRVRVEVRKRVRLLLLMTRYSRPYSPAADLLSFSKREERNGTEHRG